MPLNNYADVQTALNTFVTQAQVTPGQAPHGAFWQSLSYEDFISKNIDSGGHIVPANTAGTWKIVTPGNADASTIIQVLCGYGDAFNAVGQMPQPSPPYSLNDAQPPQPLTYGQFALVCDLRNWINAGCPNPTS
jgi:hypothetical protein